MRALAWLDRLEGDRSPEIALAKAEALLSLGHFSAAREALATAPEDPTDARAAMIRGRILAGARDEAAFTPILRAYILEAPGASELLSSALAWIPTDAETCERVRIAVDGQGEAHLARWRAAFARSRGGKNEARAALQEALRAGDTTAARPLLDAAIDDADDASLAVALAALPLTDDDDLVRTARALANVRTELGAVKGAPTEGSFAAWLDALATLSEPRLAPWVDRTRRTIFELALPKDGPAAWSLLLARLGAHARAAHDLETSANLTEVSSERRRPLRLAIVGEFNAGKSTFINALIGADVAPTGVLPTTATLHRLHYAPDPIARVVFEHGHEPPERIVPSLENLRAALKTLENEPIERVEIGIPLQALTRVEVLDTPGFNAPDPRHTQAARRAFDESDVVLWLFDATQPLKQTERTILDEVRAAGIPLQILINKADRLGPADLEKVMTSTTASLAELGLQSWSPPLAFSAKRALAAKLGDETAKAASRWNAVETMFETEIVARADALKERALRRRARAAVHMLRLHVQSLVDTETQVAEATAERAHRFAAAAAALERAASDAVDALATALTPPIDAWRA
ncbi:MAG: dynamin family protein, partial [Polyangiaceae bacterium]